MPRTTKKEKTGDFINEENKEVKKATTKKSRVASSKDTKKSTNKKTTEKASTAKKASIKSTTKKASTKNNTQFKKSIEKNTSKDNDSSIPKKPSPILEYYDLPYRYNQTLVKILAQTPTTLFVYWDISDDDRIAFTDKYGKNFFNITKPVLLIHNKTKNIYSEIEINDFANSWYLNMQEPDCEYEIELGRRNIENPSKYTYVSSSNKLISPNDHVLFEETNFTNIKFKNVKTGTIDNKDFGSIRLITNVGNIYNNKHKVYKFYNNLYKDEILENNKMFSNPSSGNPTSGSFNI